MCKMDGNVITIMGGFIATWAQMAFLYYQIGRINQKLKDLNNNNKNYGRRRK